MLTNLKPYLYTKGADSALDAQLAEAAKFGKIHLGKTALFWRAGFKRYAISLNQVQRIHRRLLPVTPSLCCGGRSFDIEYLVLILHDGTELELHIGSDEKKKAEALFAALQEAHPEIRYGKERPCSET